MLKNVLLMGSLGDFVMEAFCNLCYRLNFFNFFDFLTSKGCLVDAKECLVGGKFGRFCYGGFLQPLLSS